MWCNLLSLSLAPSLPHSYFGASMNSFLSRPNVSSSKASRMIRLLYYCFVSSTLLERHHVVSVFYSWGLHGHFFFLLQSFADDLLFLRQLSLPVSRVFFPVLFVCWRDTVESPPFTFSASMNSYLFPLESTVHVFVFLFF